MLVFNSYKDLKRFEETNSDECRLFEKISILTSEVSS